MKKYLLLLVMATFAIAHYAQPIDWNKRLPADTAIYSGKLPNGITYYLRHNEEPKGRASFFIIRNAGALLEEDDQDGLAHFLEHMAFNGSKNFPENAMISTLERHGISFGGNLNAYTSQNETVYNISDVPTANTALVDTCLLILHDWSYYLSLNADDIDKERGVITEEWRTRNNSRSRLLKQKMPVLYQGSRYADRDVIGDLNVIQNFKPEALRNFYHKWYRTDLEAISIVGDFDIKEMEQKIRNVFTSIPMEQNPTPRPFIEIPSHADMRFCLATDKEATSNDVQIMRLFRTPEYDGHGYITYGDIKTELLINFYNTMLNERIQERIQLGQAPYVAASVGLYSMMRGYHAYFISADAKPNQEREAFTGAWQDHERIMQYGFTESELQRAKQNILTYFESQLKEKDKISNDNHAKDIQSLFLQNEGVVDITHYVAAVKEILPTITAQEVSDMGKQWWKADNRVLTITGQSEGVTHLTEEEARALVAELEGKPVEPYHDNDADGQLVSDELKGSAITATRLLPQFDAEEWTLANGAKVIYRHADYEKDNVALRAYSPGGTSAYADIDMLPAAANLGRYVSAYGIGDYDDITLGKLLTGKQAGCTVSISPLYENVSGGATPQDFETMMQLLYLRFTHPRFDSLAHSVLNEQAHIQARQIAGQPQTIMKDSLSLIINNHHPRTLLFNDEYIDNITLQRVEQVYKERICDASDFTFFLVGNISKDTAMAMVQKYIGSIPSTYRAEKWTDRKIRCPKGRTERIVEIPMQVPKATGFVRFEKEMKYNLRQAHLISILGEILTTRYTKSIREEQGGTYGVGVRGSAQYEPYQSYTLFMTFDCAPDAAATLKPLLYKELDNVIKQGVTEEELSKIIKNKLKEAEQGKNHNNYWLGTIMNYYKTGIDANDPKNFEDILNGITTKDVQAFAKKFMKKADVVDILFTPKAE